MKFKKSDEIYKEKRNSISKKMGKRDVWSIIDHWPLYVGNSNLARYLAIADILKSTLNVPGHIAEFGSWKGANLMFMAKLMRIYDPMGAKQIHCFESFEGLSTFTPEDGTASNTLGEYAGNYEELMEMINLYDFEDDIVIHKGLIQDTLHTLLAKDKGISFSFVYCDTDLFEPTDLILRMLHDRLAKGGVFVFDEWNYEKWQGETIAANKFMADFSDYYEMEHITDTRQPSMLLRKIRS